MAPNPRKMVSYGRTTTDTPARIDKRMILTIASETPEYVGIGRGCLPRSFHLWERLCHFSYWLISLLRFLSDANFRNRDSRKRIRPNTGSTLALPG